MNFVEEEFQELQDDFMEQHYREFDDNEENKLIYTEIHRQYVSANTEVVRSWVSTWIK